VADFTVSVTARDPAAVERSNLVNISKLVVKELIETSLKHGRMLDSDHMPLQHFFIVLEHVMRHGLKPKKVLLFSPYQKNT
jgi:RUN and FYVE domain-containing protein 1/2